MNTVNANVHMTLLESLMQLENVDNMETENMNNQNKLIGLRLLQDKNWVKKNPERAKGMTYLLCAHPELFSGISFDKSCKVRLLSDTELEDETYSSFQTADGVYRNAQSMFHKQQVDTKRNQLRKKLMNRKSK